MQEMLMTGEEGNTERKQDFFPVKLSSFFSNTIPGFDLYIWPGPRRPMVLYREKNLAFTEEIRQRLLESTVTHLHVRVDQGSEYQKYVETNLKNILQDTDLKSTEKSDILYSTSVGLVKDLIADPRSGEIIKRCERLVDSAVSFMFNTSNAFASLLKVTSFDYYTYTHCVNVFVFSVALAKHMGFPESSVLQIGTGALLHDVGKADLDPAIVNCRGKLSHDQWDQMKRHPSYGHNILKEQGVRDHITLSITRYHHEKLDGTGYPEGLRDGDLPSFIRLCTIVDIFDALTTRRSYKDALQSFNALKLMQTEMNSSIDRVIFRKFIDLMGAAAA